MSIILFIIILVVLILVHEFGHLVVAKLTGIRVDEFSIGFFRPKLFSKKIGETEYSFRPLLLGGYVKIFGEDPDQESMFGPDKERSFVNKPKWVQAAVLVAGVGFNILLAWFIFSFVFMIGMPTVVSNEERGSVTDPKLVIIDVLPESPAGLVGFKNGDELLQLIAEEESTYIESAEEVIAFISSHPGEEITISHKRGEDILETSVVPRGNLIPSDPERAAIGISMGIVGTQQLLPHRALWEGGKFTISMLGLVGAALGGFFASIFTFTADFFSSCRANRHCWSCWRRGGTWRCTTPPFYCNYFS